jgi:outer membrane protein assembly factor BamB
MPHVTTLSRAWTARLDGAVYAEPLLVGGLLIVATEQDTVYALDPATGAISWRQHLGTPVPRTDLPCGDIDPLGITGTPVYDARTKKLFVVAELQRAGTISHELFALEVSAGRVVGSRTVDPPGADPRVQQQRAALALAEGRVYVAFGGLYGDCGNYHGYVVGIRTDLIGQLAAFSPLQSVPSAVGGGIWAPSGPVIDASSSLYVALGNGRTSPPYDLSDSVIELSPTLGLRDYFAPSGWALDNASDLDLGSTSPALAGSYVYADGKSGTAYLLRTGGLGHIGGQLASASVCRAFGGDAVVGTRIFVPCTDGIRAVDVGSGKIEIIWHAAVPSATGPPVVGGGAVWSIGIEDGVLYALNQRTGSLIASVKVGDVEHFATPTLWDGFAFIPTASGLVAVRGD